MKILYLLLLVYVFVFQEDYKPTSISQKGTKINDFLKNPLKNFDSIKVAHSKKWTSDIFNNKGKLFKPLDKGVFVEYNFPEIFSIIVMKKEYGLYEDKNEYIVSVNQSQFEKGNIFRYEINIGTSAESIKQLFGIPHEIRDSVYMYHDKKNKVAFFHIQNKKVRFIQVSQFNINIAKTKLPLFERDGGVFYPKK